MAGAGPPHGQPWRAPRTGCDPHRLGMAGAGPLLRHAPARGTRVAILTDLEWPVLVLSGGGHDPGAACCDPHRLGMAGAGGSPVPRLASRLLLLRSSPTWNGRCWDAPVPRPRS